MNLTMMDLRKLQIPLVTLLVAITFAWFMVSAADSRETKAQQALQTQQAALAKARDQYQSSGTEKSNIAQYLPVYQTLIDRGFVGEEQRLDWISDLRNVNQHYKLFGVSYDIATQEDYKPKFPVVVGNFKLHRSVMKLTLAMLDEEDLIALFNALPGEVNPPFMPRDCTITQTNPSPRGRFEPNLNATCEIDWLTIAEPKTSP
ncbi:MAG TPA: hypothetical protein VIE17_00615 [Methylophilaceae bacterium]|jgi:hypothetical protein